MHATIGRKQARLQQIGDGLTTVRNAARAERDLHGRVLPETAKLLVERVAEAEDELATEGTQPQPWEDDSNGEPKYAPEPGIVVGLDLSKEEYDPAFLSAQKTLKTVMDSNQKMKANPSVGTEIKAAPKATMPKPPPLARLNPKPIAEKG